MKAGLLQLTDRVLVMPADVAAVTQDPDTAEWTRLYLRGAGFNWLLVERPLHEVAQLLETAQAEPPIHIRVTAHGRVLAGDIVEAQR